MDKKSRAGLPKVSPVKTCKTCRWYASFEGVCCNGDSEHRAGFRLENNWCEEWEGTQTKTVMISIRPQWCELIMRGAKTIEVRKTRPNMETPFKCYIYCTNPQTKDPHQILETHTGGKIRRCNGKVIGEFVCDTFVVDKTCGRNDLFNGAACIEKEAAMAYAQGKTLYGWHISKLRIYDYPRNLNQFSSRSSVFETNDHGRLALTGLRRPPQSWCYVEERYND